MARCRCSCNTVRCHSPLARSDFLWARACVPQERLDTLTALANSLQVVTDAEVLQENPAPITSQLNDATTSRPPSTHS